MDRRRACRSPLVKPGEFRKQIRTGNRRIPGAQPTADDRKEYMSDILIPGEMQNLIEKTANRFEKKHLDSIENHPLYIVSEFHNEFLNEIHPFDNGNGRTFRLIQGAIYMLEGYPPVVNYDREVYIQTIIDCEKIKSPLPIMHLFMDTISNYIDDITSTPDR